MFERTDMFNITRKKGKFGSDLGGSTVLYLVKE
jgi:hypothetical protein